MKRLAGWAPCVYAGVQVGDFFQVSTWSKNKRTATVLEFVVTEVAGVTETIMDGGYGDPGLGEFVVSLQIVICYDKAWGNKKYRNMEKYTTRNEILQRRGTGVCVWNRNMNGGVYGGVYGSAPTFTDHVSQIVFSRVKKYRKRIAQALGGISL